MALRDWNYDLISPELLSQYRAYIPIATDAGRKTYLELLRKTSNDWQKDFVDRSIKWDISDPNCDSDDDHYVDRGRDDAFDDFFDVVLFDELKDCVDLAVLKMTRCSHAWQLGESFPDMVERVDYRLADIAEDVPAPRDQSGELYGFLAPKQVQELLESIAASLDGIEAQDVERFYILKRKYDNDWMAKFIDDDADAAHGAHIHNGHYVDPVTTAPHAVFVSDEEADEFDELVPKLKAAIETREPKKIDNFINWPPQN